MTVYAWPAGWLPNRFEMRVLPNYRAFIGPYTPSTQVVDLLGERWQISMDLPPTTDTVLGAAREAFFDRLMGPVNQVAVWNLKFPRPQGTLLEGGGVAQWKTASAANATWQTSAPAPAAWSYTSPTLAAVALQGSATLVINRTPGTSAFAGDMVGVGGQLFRAMAAASADGNGLMTLEVQPRVRADIAISTAVICAAPTAKFILKAEGVPTVWRPGMAEGASLELIEAI